MSWTVERVPAGWRAEDAENQISDDENDRRGDDLIEGILDEST